MDVQILKAEQERQGKLIEGLVKDLQLKTTDIQSLKAELEQLKKDGLDRAELLRAELEQQKKDEELSTHFLTVILRDNKKDRLNKEAGFKAELERLRNMLGELNKQFNNQSLRVEQKEHGTDNDNLKSHPVNCTDAKFNGINEILIPNFSSQPFKVACDAETQGGRWTVILKRIDGSVDFYQDWAAYKDGFGDLNGEFFLGLDKIHTLTTERTQELLVVLEDFKGNETYELYEEFGIGNETQQYVLHTLGKASGTAGDSLSYHRGMKFTTFDRDNDLSTRNCAIFRTGAWWYKACHKCNLTGYYNDTGFGMGIIWEHFRGQSYSLKKVVMMIRPKKDKL
ncbi:microfibril-associated glycoprotein 4-like [Drosophila innubila]|uniref:microfibril-associated glycoprotein 4-like n=1 Tax=Drosophila innubila TaxID=198719 RepID=UPI00148B8F2D|nr:microfibril-associated glycoprotein 4-like [Drosophila innubila]